MLNQNYPNPFNPKTVISYNLAEYSRVKLKIYDTCGREVVTLTDKEQSAGIHEIEFDGSNLSSGLYLYEITAGNYSQIKKMILMR